MTLRKPGTGPSGPPARSGENAPDSPAPIKAPRFTLKPSKQTIWVLGGMTGFVLAGCVTLYVWQTAEMAEIQKKVDEKRTEVASGQKIASRLKKVEDDYALTAGQIRFLETSVTANEYVPTLLRQTEQLAKSVNLKVNSVRPTLEPAPKPPADKEARKTFKTWPYDKIHIDMDVTGSYWSTAKMLYRLTEFPKILSVETVQITPQGGAVAAAGSPKLGVRLRLTGFIFPDDGKPVAPGALPESGAASVVTPGVTPVNTPAQQRALRPAASSPLVATRAGA
ncbi:MAG: type 4a pilus biogenesis protein PilO [Cytophagales bacterium]|nr:type 4a pilus biogenesis protein PilO [Armatimonadota bacterium]